MQTESLGKSATLGLASNLLMASGTYTDATYSQKNQKEEIAMNTRFAQRLAHSWTSAVLVSLIFGLSGCAAEASDDVDRFNDADR